MAAGSPSVDGESQLLFEELLETPVGRRWLLKAGLGSAALAVGVGASPAPAAGRRMAASVPGTLQFALGHLKGVSGLVLVANGARHPLVRHTAGSRGALRAQGGLWGKLDLSVLSHHVSGVSLPAHRAMVVSVLGRRGRREVVVAQLWHVPQATVLALARTAQRYGGSLRAVLPSRERLRGMGLRGAQLGSPREVAQLATVVDTGSTAIALVMHHPQAATVDSTSAGTTSSLLGQTPEVGALGNYIQTMQRQGRPWATLVQATDRDGSPSKIRVGDTTTTFSTFELNRDDQTFVRSIRSALTAGVRGVRDTSTLGAVIDKPLEQQPPAVTTKTWVQSQGVVARPKAYSPSLAAGAGVDIAIKNSGFLFGTHTNVNGGYANGQVPLKIYNNFVRWMWVYVQYLGKNNENLSANPNARFPDTKYSQSLGLLPQVFTVLGVPIWDTNSIEVTLKFPPGAHTARLLYCGLGSDILGGGWRQYFPSDAYPDRIAPTDEVLTASLMTGILTIGLNVMALATDLNIAAAWSALRGTIADLLSGPVAEETIRELTLLTNVAIGLTASEALATGLAAGQATYDEVNANGGASNLWSLLLGLGTVIVKLIFNPRTVSRLLAAVAPKLLAVSTANKVLQAVPLIGEVLAVVEAVGDAVTLGEVAVETLVCPWVIENEVTLTYKTTVTISHDPRDGAGFPATARSWRLEASVDGAVVLDPITGSINEGGKVRSDPLVLRDLVAPFGGQLIQWSIVFLDQGGRQVGTGASGKFGNDDPNNVPSNVSFAITELPAAVTASTVFKRAATTTYSSADGGYTWSDRVSVPGTEASGGIQEVTGAAFATLLGVAGVVFKQDDRFWLRGVPAAQNGATIGMGVAPKEGYARRPFLLFDALVGKGDQANHVLLEPDETSDAYHVRRLTLDPVNGALSWDPTASLGMFTLPVSAAALHSSGRVVALHTDSGRVGWLQPVSTPRPQLAAYSGGPGTQVGLLSSPIALAVTNPGVVLVLEAAGPQLAAFDLNGNPVPYFAQSALRSRRPGASRRAGGSRRRLSSPSLAFTLPLDTTKTYLDVAVDGAAQIYLLGHTGDGSAPQDYRVDVYTPTGVPLDTNSPGMNVPHLAVDYWRSIYAPNYDPLTNQGTTTPHIDPRLGVKEPSLSRFEPNTPAARRKTGKPRPRKPKATTAPSGGKG